MLPLDSRKPYRQDPEDIKWSLEKGQLIHSQYDPDFDNTATRKLYRRVLKADVEVHTSKDYFDKRFMVKPPEDPAALRYQKWMQRERKNGKDEKWLKKNTTSVQDLVNQQRKVDLNEPVANV